MRLLRRKALAREKVAVRSPGTHGADHIGADGGGNQADLDLAEAKARRVGRHRHIAAGHQAHAARIDIALHTRNRGFGAFVDDAQHLGQQARIDAVLVARVIGHAAHPVQVRARAECGSFGGQHHGAHIGTLADLNEGGGDLGNRRIAEGVANGGLSQRDAGDAAVHGQSQSSHGLSPSELELCSCAAAVPGSCCIRNSRTCGNHCPILAARSKNWCPSAPLDGANTSFRFWPAAR